VAAMTMAVNPFAGGAAGGIIARPSLVGTPTESTSDFTTVLVARGGLTDVPAGMSDGGSDGFAPAATAFDGGNLFGSAHDFVNLAAGDSAVESATPIVAGVTALGAGSNSGANASTFRASEATTASAISGLDDQSAAGGIEPTGADIGSTTIAASGVERLVAGSVAHRPAECEISGQLFAQVSEEATDLPPPAPGEYSATVNCRVDRDPAPDGTPGKSRGLAVRGDRVNSLGPINLALHQVNGELAVVARIGGLDSVEEEAVAEKFTDVVTDAGFGGPAIQLNGRAIGSPGRSTRA